MVELLPSLSHVIRSVVVRQMPEQFGKKHTQVNKKISEVHRWTSRVPIITFVDDMTEMKFVIFLSKPGGC